MVTAYRECFLLSHGVTDMQTDEAQIEQRIRDAGLNAPRITPSHIDSQIVREDYHTFPGLPGEGPRVTVCMLTLRNGYQVVGESSCLDHRYFDEQIGHDIARNRAREKIWALEAYLLHEKLSRA